MRISIALLFIFVSHLCFSLDLDISGYFEHQSGFTFDKNPEISSYNKLRLDFSKNVNDYILFNSDAIFLNYNGLTSFSLIDYIPETLVQDYLQNMGNSITNLQNQFMIHLKDEVMLDNAFLRVYLKKINIRIGKQQIALGSGYAWNPTDVFNRKDMLDPTYEKTGINAIKIEYPFSNEGCIYSIFSLEENWQNTTKGIYIKNHFLGYDMELSYSQKTTTKLDLNQYIDIKIKDDLLGLNFSGMLFGFGLWNEFAYSKSANKDYLSNVLGMDYTFENGCYLMAEYFFNERGKSHKKDYQFENWIYSFLYNENLAQNYLYLGESTSITELMELSNFLVINLMDNSFNYSPWINYSLSDNLELNIKADIPIGSKNSEFNSYTNSFAARIKFYF